MSADDELSRLYDAHAGALFGYLLNLTRDEGDTRDLLQALFCQLARHAGLPQDVRDERAFLLRMAHNATVDLIRRRESGRRLNETVASDAIGMLAPSADPDVQAFRQELESSLAQLPVEQRAVVHLKLWEGLTFEAIAEALNIPPNTAASRYRYGIDKLRTLLRPLYDEIQ